MILVPKKPPGEVNYLTLSLMNGLDSLENIHAAVQIVLKSSFCICQTKALIVELKLAWLVIDMGDENRIMIKSIVFPNPRVKRYRCNFDNE